MAESIQSLEFKQSVGPDAFRERWIATTPIGTYEIISPRRIHGLATVRFTPISFSEVGSQINILYHSERMNFSDCYEIADRHWKGIANLLLLEIANYGRS